MPFVNKGGFINIASEDLQSSISASSMSLADLTNIQAALKDYENYAVTGGMLYEVDDTQTFDETKLDMFDSAKHIYKELILTTDKYDTIILSGDFPTDEAQITVLATHLKTLSLSNNVKIIKVVEKTKGLERG